MIGTAAHRRIRSKSTTTVGNDMRDQTSPTLASYCCIELSHNMRPLCQSSQYIVSETYLPSSLDRCIKFRNGNEAIALPAKGPI